jgi:hypothetical protein
VQALQGVSGLLLRLKLHKSVVVLDVHAPQLAKGLKVALQVTLTRVLRVKVHHKQRGVGLDCPAPLVLPALDVTITLGPLNLEPPASVAKLFAIEAADGVIPVTFVFHEHKRKAWRSRHSASVHLHSKLCEAWVKPVAAVSKQPLRVTEPAVLQRCQKGLSGRR